MQVVLSSAVPAVSTGAASLQALRPPILELMFSRVKTHQVPFNAQDIYQVCTVAFNVDTLGMLQDADFMRGIADAFRRSDQSVLSPFQVNLVMDSLRKAGIHAQPTEVAVPEEDAVSPESLLNALSAMNITRTRDERKVGQIVQLMLSILDEFAPSQLAQTVVELAKLQCSNTDIIGKLVKRLLCTEDELSPLDISLVAKSLALARGVAPNVVRRFYAFVEAHLDHFHAEDYVNVLRGLQSLGPAFCGTFSKLVEAGLENVESMDALTLTHFLTCFTVMEYRQREQIDIYADALVDVATDLEERDLVQAFVALQQLNLLDESMFSTMATCTIRFAAFMSPRNIGPVMDICSRVPHNSDMLMRALLDRAAECTRIFSAHELAEILDIVSVYPPARSHPLVGLFGKQARLRVELMGPEPLARATNGLAHLGFVDAEYYTLAAQTGFRFGFKNWSFLEPIMVGLTISGGCPMFMVKVIASHLAPMARSMTLPEVQRANHYISQLGCEEDYVYKALAARVLQFVKEITPEMPDELKVLLQRGASNRVNEAPTV